MDTEKLYCGPGAEAFYTLRGETSARDNYSGFNVCAYTGDSSSHIDSCMAELSLMLNIPKERIIIPHQTHSSRISVISEIPARNYLIENCDGLVTRLKEVALCINTADCVPVLLHNPYAGIIGACHAGWRGILNGVIQNCIRTITSLGGAPHETYAAIGPCICACCFEVGEEVAARFEHMPETVVRENEPAKPHVNLRAAVTHILRESGISKNHITPAPECTMCNPERLFSARVSGISSGRILSVVKLA